MEKVIIDELPENSLFHFTHIDNYETIDSEGLKPIIGENAFGIEETPKIFFSKGELGIIKVNEVWLRWLMNRIFGPNDRLNKYKELTPNENERRIYAWIKEFLSGEYKNDTEKKEELFAYFYSYLKERIYFVLDIEDKKEYDSEDLDENKVKLNDPSGINERFAKIMYGEFSDMQSKIMDDWNMHTKTGQSIDKTKIKQVVTEDGMTDMLSIVLYVYDKHKDMPHVQLLLDDFVLYAKKRLEIEEMTKEEGLKDDQNSYGGKH